MSARTKIIHWQTLHRYHGEILRRAPTSKPWVGNLFLRATKPLTKSVEPGTKDQGENLSSNDNRRKDNRTSKKSNHDSRGKTYSSISALMHGVQTNAIAITTTICLGRSRRDVETLIDTGADTNNYISENLAKWALTQGAVSCKCKVPQVVCSFFTTTECVVCEDCVTLTIKFPRTLTHYNVQDWLNRIKRTITKETAVPVIDHRNCVNISLSFVITPNASSDLVLSLDTISKYDLTSLCRQRFVSERIWRLEAGPRPKEASRQSEKMVQQEEVIVPLADQTKYISETPSLIPCTYFQRPQSRGA